MTTTRPSESMNNFFKKYLKRTLSFKSFVIQYDEVLTTLRETENYEDFRSRQKKEKLRTEWPIKIRAAERYTPYMFSHFQKEILHTLDLISEVAGQDGPVLTYKVTSFYCSLARTVTYNSSDNFIECSCKQFQFMGVFCAHSLKIFHLNQLLEPSKYYLSRWTVDAKADIGMEEPGRLIQGINTSSTQQYSELDHMDLSLATKGTSTGTSGSYTKKLLTGAMEELDKYLQSNQHDHTEKKENVVDANDKDKGEGSLQIPLGVNITVRDPPRRKKSSKKKAGRIKMAYEKNKSKSATTKKAVTRTTKTKPTTVKRKRQSQKEPSGEKQRAKKRKRPQVKPTDKYVKAKKLYKLNLQFQVEEDGIEVSPFGSDVEEIAPFGTDVELDMVEGETTPRVVGSAESNESFLALLSQQSYPG
ncbi:protein FAR1-RELATED SEQUENCE 9-like [Papaver somniferum]|uniref:protein FAR1-RELATED SEQUENCE 9-like n=1 Tax=Papaver somniferum TaxID=3469 RepID=UPI000E6FC111|nr:protein FAR1-RELATED SEQUENCE 9-like [Papaver somniferum]